MLTESGLIAFLSGVAGIVLAAVTLHALKLLLPPDTPRLANIALHGDVLVFAAKALEQIASADEGGTQPGGANTAVT